MSHEAPTSPLEDPHLGRVINERFRVVAAISRDHVGRVYRAEQLPLGRPVSIKVLDPRYGRRGDDVESQFQQRFLIEASVASRLHHPNTVRVFDYGCTPEGLCFTTCELVEGRSLKTVIAEERTLSAERVVHIAVQVARSLREAHRVGIVHGNIKPASIMLTRHGDEDDFVKVCDFGLVRPSQGDDLDDLTQQSMYTGAPKYMAPERIRGDHSDARADIYSVGACMYEMLTGRVPFDRPNAVAILMAHMQETAPPIDRFDCPPALARLVTRCLAKAPSERPASMDDVIVLLKQAAGRSVHSTMPLLASHDSLSITPGPLPAFGEVVPGPALITSGHAPAPAAPTLPPARHPNAWLPKLGVAGALIIAAGFIALRHREASATRPPAAVQGEARSATVVPAAAMASRPQTPDSFRLRVRLSSLPAGAHVEVAGRRYGPTPADIELWGEAVMPGRELTFVFDKSGYERASVSRLVRGDSLDLDVILERSGGRGERPSAEPAPVAAPEATPEPAYARLEQWPAMNEMAAPPPAAAAPVPTAPVEPVVAAAPVAAPAPAPAVVAKPVAVAKPAPPAAKKPAPLATHSALRRDQDRIFPQYPRHALRSGVAGIVVARVHVRPDGRVGSVDVLDGPEVFHDVVKKALKTWLYTPARLADGSAVADTQIVRVPFQLK